MAAGDLVSSMALTRLPSNSTQADRVGPRLFSSSPFADLKTSWWPLPWTVTHQPQLLARLDEDLPLSAISVCDLDRCPAHQLPCTRAATLFCAAAELLPCDSSGSSRTAQYHGTYYPPYPVSAPH